MVWACFVASWPGQPAIIDGTMNSELYILTNAGLNTTQCWVKYGLTQQLGCLDPAFGLLPRRLG